MKIRTYLTCLHGPHIFKDQIINIMLDVHLEINEPQFSVWGQQGEPVALPSFSPLAALALTSTACFIRFIWASCRASIF